MKISDIVVDELTSLNERERVKHKNRTPGVFYPSESMQCQRKIYISVIHPERKKEKMPLGLFHMAKFAEESVIKCVQSKPGLCVQEQVRLEREIAPDVIIHGYIDFELLDDDGYPTHVYEIKSIGNLSYMEKATEAKIHHRAQLQCYLQTVNCNKGGIIYVERGDIGKIKQFDDSKDEKLWTDIKKHFSELSEYMRDAQLPPPVPCADWECKYCEFADGCKEERKKKGIKSTTVWENLC